MKDEPEIVKELRQEEQCGKLQSFFRRKDRDIDYSVLPYDSPAQLEKEDDESQDGSTIQVNIEHERRLLEAEDRYEKIFRLSPEAIALIDKNGVFVDVNERLHDWLGFRSDEILGKSFLEVPIFTVDEKIKAKNKFLQRIAGKEVPPYELEFITKNQEKRIGIVRGAPLKDEWGNVVQSLLMISDITNQKPADDARKNNAAIVESTDDAIIGKNLDGIITSWNPAAERIYGYSKQEAIGRPISLLLPPGTKNDIPELLKRIEQGERIHHYETVRRKKNGERITVSLTISPIKDETGMIVGASTIARDITERKTLDQELTLKNKILDLVADPVFLCDGEGRFLYVNIAACTSRGYTRDELMRIRLYDLVAPKDRTALSSQIQKLKETGEGRFQIEECTKNGGLIPVEMHAWLIEYGEQKLILNLTHDGTMQKKEQKVVSDAHNTPDGRHTQRTAKAGKQHHHQKK